MLLLMLAFCLSAITTPASFFMAYDIGNDSVLWGLIALQTVILLNVLRMLFKKRRTHTRMDKPKEQVC